MGSFSRWENFSFFFFTCSFNWCYFAFQGFKLVFVFIKLMLRISDSLPPGACLWHCSHWICIAPALVSIFFLMSAKYTNLSAILKNCFGVGTASMLLVFMYLWSTETARQLSIFRFSYFHSLCSSVLTCWNSFEC